MWIGKPSRGDATLDDGSGGMRRTRAVRVRWHQLLRGSAKSVYNAPGTFTSALDGRKKSGFRIGVTSAHPEFRQRAGRESSAGRHRE